MLGLPSMLSRRFLRRAKAGVWWGMMEGPPGIPSLVVSQPARLCGLCPNPRAWGPFGGQAKVPVIGILRPEKRFSAPSFPFNPEEPPVAAA